MCSKSEFLNVTPQLTFLFLNCAEPGDEDVVTNAIPVQDMETQPVPNKIPEQTPQYIPVGIISGALGRFSVPLQCPFCHKLVHTQTRSRVDGLTLAFMCIMILLFWPLFWLPLCCPACKSVQHFCPNCHQQLGVTASFS